MDKVIDLIVNAIANNFEFGYMIVVNVATYLGIKLIDFFNGDNVVPTYQKRCVLVIMIFFISMIYMECGYDNAIVLLNSAILAPVCWSWIISPILKKLGIGYKDIDKVLR